MVTMKLKEKRFNQHVEDTLGILMIHSGVRVRGDPREQCGSEARTVLWIVRTDTPEWIKASSMCWLNRFPFHLIVTIAGTVCFQSIYTNIYIVLLYL